jgi:hypothetical protein
MRLYVSRSEYPFVVLDALRTGVAKARPFIRSSKFTWYVFSLRGRFFVFRAREVREILLDARPSRSLADALKLEKTAPSQVIHHPRTQWITISELPVYGHPESRAVFIYYPKEKEAVVADVGQILKSRPMPRTEPKDREDIFTGREARTIKRSLVKMSGETGPLVR